eukprot:scaffold406141_cov35-Attheya_sp.AAC.1
MAMSSCCCTKRSVAHGSNYIMRFLLEKLEDLRYSETCVSAISQIWEGIHSVIVDAGDVYHMKL